MKKIVLATLAAGFVSCSGDAKVPTAAPSNEPAVVIPVTCAGNEAVTARLVVAPPYGSELRDGQTIELGVEFSLPWTAYPTSVDFSIIYPNKRGGFSGESCRTVKREHHQPVDLVLCTFTVRAATLADPEWGAAGPIDIDFDVFNWVDEQHACELNYYKRFPRGYVFRQ